MRHPRSKGKCQQIKEAFIILIAACYRVMILERYKSKCVTWKYKTKYFTCKLQVKMYMQDTGTFWVRSERHIPREIFQARGILPEVGRSESRSRGNSPRIPGERGESEKHVTRHSRQDGGAHDGSDGYVI